ncbi:MAG: TetR/AcrR family transcriptional regulator [Deinococcota bacterium]
MSSSGQKTPTAKSYHHGDLRTALVKAAREVLLETGAGKLSLRAVARHAGVSHAAAYYHFEDKTSLIAAVAIDAFEELNHATKAAYEQGGSLLERSKAMFAAYINFALEHPQAFRIMFLPELRSDAVRTDVETAGRQGHEFTVSVIQQLQQADQVVKDDPERIAISLWAMLHGLATLMIDGPLYRNAKTQQGRETLIQTATDHLLHGILHTANMPEELSE